MKTLLRVAAVTALLLPLTATPGAAQQGDDDPAVARVNGATIYRSEVLEAASALPPEYQAQLATIFPTLVERIVDFHLISKAAESAGLSDDQEVKDRVAALKVDVMREVYLQRQVDSRITETTLRARYDTFVTENPPKQEVRARHILLDDEAAAVEVIAELDKGADFATLASERSNGPSKARGGDLGYFTAEQMVPEFSQQAFALETGKYSSKPVQTQFGWHVIKVEDRRESEPPSFESLEEQLREDMSRETVNDVITDLRETAEIEILPTPGLPGATTAQ
ncbi:MAG: peptidylprolyl isomerase [Kiloniellales bacterium]|nr:peptidylprolyl isomerase [Kiloniellales bacterium]